MNRYSHQHQARPAIPFVVFFGFVFLLTMASFSRAQSAAPPESPTNEERQRRAVADQREMSRELTPDEIQRDLVQLRKLIHEKWLLSNLNDADFNAAIGAVNARGADGLAVAEFTIEIQRILSLGADGHASLAHFTTAQRDSSSHFLPFTVEPIGDRYVAIKANDKRRNQSWSSDYPYINAIDGIPIEKWIDVAMPFVVRSHPLSMRTQAAYHLEYAGFFRRRLGLKDAATYSIALESRDGHEKTIRVEALSYAQMHGLWYNYFSRPKSQILDGNIGYLWIRNPAGNYQKLIIDMMPQFRDTQGLVLDFRKNQGGAGTEMLQLLGCWLTFGDNSRQIAGIQRRIVSDEPGSNSPAYHEGSPEVTAVGKELINRFRHNVETSWSAPEGIAVKDWYTLLASPRVEPNIYAFPLPVFRRIVPVESIYEYRQPVMVLCDRHCFSAAEIIIGGLQTLPQVTVIGERTRGGGGVHTAHTLQQSGILFSLTTESVCLTSAGKLIDGNGIIPDVPVAVDIETIVGDRDTMLEEALKRLKQRNAATPR